MSHEYSFPAYPEHSGQLRPSHHVCGGSVGDGYGPMMSNRVRFRDRTSEDQSQSTRGQADAQPYLGDERFAPWNRSGRKLCRSTRLSTSARRQRTKMEYHSRGQRTYGKSACNDRRSGQVWHKRGKPDCHCRSAENAIRRSCAETIASVSRRCATAYTYAIDHRDEATRLCHANSPATSIPNSPDNLRRHVRQRATLEYGMTAGSGPAAVALMGPTREGIIPLRRGVQVGLK